MKLNLPLKRVPRSQERIRSHAQENIDSVSKEFFEEIDIAIADNPQKEQVLSDKRKEAETIFKEYEERLSKNFIINIMSQESIRVATTIKEMTWRFLTFDNKPAFITSDNPVFFFEHIGIGNQYSEITLPISTHVTLWATWRNVKEGYFPTTEQAVKEITRRTVAAATRNVFSSFHAPWILTLVNKPRHRLTSLLI